MLEIWQTFFKKIFINLVFGFVVVPFNEHTKKLDEGDRLQLLDQLPIECLISYIFRLVDTGYIYTLGI